MLTDVRKLHQPDPARQLRARRRRRRYLRAPRRGAGRTTRCSPGWSTSTTPTSSPAGCRSWRRRDFTEPVALNWTDFGTDVDFGALTQQLIDYAAQRAPPCTSATRCATSRRESDGRWTVKVRNTPHRRRRRKIHARFVFVGAGGGALPLLQKSGIPEAKGFGGFPVGGQFLRTANRALVAQHQAKVYGKAAGGRAADVGAAPGHPRHRRRARGCCSARTPAGRRSSSSRASSPTCRSRSNRTTSASMLGVGVTEMGLTKYLIGELMQSDADRIRHAARVRARRAVERRLGAHRRRPASPGDPQEKGTAACCEFGTAVVTAPTAASRACSAPRRARPPRCRPCSTSWSAASPRARRLGAEAEGNDPVARHQAVRGARSCSTRCGTGPARHCSSSLPTPAIPPSSQSPPWCDASV